MTGAENTPEESVGESDHIGDLLVRGKDASLPRSFREKHGSSEPMFASAYGLAFLHEMLQMLKTIHQGIVALEQQELLAKKFIKEVRQGSPAHKLAVAMLAIGKENVKTARQVIGSDFDSINSLATIAMCTVYEVATEDTMKALLRFSPGLIPKMSSLEINTDKLPSDRDLTYAEATLALKKLKEWCRKQNKVVPEGDILMFNCLGVPINPAITTKSAIRELIYVRNCIAHKAKRADSKCKDEAPRLGLVDGHIFSVRRSDMGVYVKALLALLNEVFEKINSVALNITISTQEDQQ